MKDVEKQILIITGAIFLGFILVISGITQLIHDISIQAFRPSVSKYAKERTDSIMESIGFTIEIIFAVILMFTPIRGTAGVWFLSIAYKLTLGDYRSFNVFIVHHKLNYVMAVLCLILGLYSFYSQQKWAQNYINPPPKEEIKDEFAKFI
jgi:hypothetical protein